MKNKRSILLNALTLFLAISCLSINSATNTDVDYVPTIATLDKSADSSSATTTPILPTPPIENNVPPPDVIQLCPEERSVELKDIRAPGNLGLVIKKTGSKDESYWILSLESGSTTILPKYYSENNSQYHLVGKSPNSEWLTYVTANTKEENSLLIESLLSNEKYESIIPIPEFSYLAWINDDQIVFYGQDGVPGREQRDVPIAFLDPFTGLAGTYETKEIPTDAIILLALEVDGSPNVLYYYPYHFDIQSSSYRASFVLHDLFDGSSEDVFPWMDVETKNWSLYNLGFFSVSLNNATEFLVVNSKPYGFDFVGNLPMPNLKVVDVYNNIMQAIELSDGQPDVMVQDTTDDSSRFYFVRFNGGDYQSPLPENLYYYDIKDNIVGDYCLDLGYTGYYMTSALSPNDDFLAWNDYGLEINNQLVGIHILNTSTGSITAIQGYEFVCWVKLAE